MRTFFFLIGFCFAANLSAQTDTTISSTYTNIHTITKEDIERLPATSFMQIVQGAFPFVGSESMVEEEYTFLINGFILTNPNAINLSQIESISFFPAGTEFTRGSLTKKGSFVITTKPQNTRFSLSTKNGIVFPGDETAYLNNTTVSSSKGLTSLSEISYSHSDEKWFLSNAFSFLKSENPELTLTTTNQFYSSKLNSASQISRFRFSNFGGYEFSPRWKVQGGLFFSEKPGTVHSVGKFNSLQTNDETRTVSKSTGKLNYIAGNAGLSSLLSNNLSNNLTTEFAKNNAGSDLRSDDEYNAGTRLSTSKLQNRSTEYAISDKVSWAKNISSSFHLNLSLLARYRTAKTYERKDSFNQQIVVGGSPSISNSGYIRRGNSRSFILNPSVSMRFKGIVYADLGFAYDTYANSWSGRNQHKKLLPDAGLRAELSSLFKKTILSSLEISFNYNTYLTSFERYDRLGTQYTPNTVFGRGPFVGTYANPSLYGNYPPVKNWLAAVGIGLNKNRLLVKAQYRHHERTVRSYVIIPPYMGGPQISHALLEQLISTGLCFEVKATLLEKENKHWDIYATTFQDKYSRNSGPFYPTTEEVILMDSGKAPWRSGLRTSVNINRFFVQASAILNFRELGVDKNGDIREDMERFASNFLTAGYSIAFKNTWIKSLEISGQSIGLLSLNSHFLAKYIGLGVQANF